VEHGEVKHTNRNNTNELNELFEELCVP
jgi:hypothetical protein